MMRLARLDLTRFGHFTDRRVTFGPPAADGTDFHIIHGPNEAGKTTLMEAYLRLIYGFPARGDGYGFKHPLNTLQVGGLVEINGQPTELIRTKRTTNSLMDPHGDALPETLLQSCLGGIAEQDYRKLFCLDDATIEAGGEEITASKGDFGRLLFAAAAGIGNLTHVLDQVAERADAFHRRGASKTVFAGLKRDLDGVVRDIKAQDVTPAAYHALRQALDAATAAEVAARRAKDGSDLRRSQLVALIAAYPLLADLRATEADLAPLAQYPATLDIDPEALVAMMTTRVRLEADRTRAAQMQQAAHTAQTALVPRPDILALAPDILALDDLHGRMKGALADLPLRRAEREAALADMRARVIDLGLDPGDDPARFVLPDHQLTALERRLQAVQQAETALHSAQAEAIAAELALQTSAALQASAQAAVTIGPEVDDLLIRHDAAHCVQRHQAAQTQLTQARAVLAQRLRALSQGNLHVTALPAATVTLSQAQTLVTDTLSAAQRVATLRDTCAAAAEKSAKAQARLAVLQSAADLVTDDLALTTRAARDHAWARHRAALDPATADAFAQSLAQDDATTALRLAQTRDIAEFRQAQIAADEAALDLHAAKARLAEAETAQTTLDQTRAAHLARLALPPDLGPADLVDWLHRLQAARQAADDLHQTDAATEDALRLGQALHHDLAQLPGLRATDGLDMLHRQAQALADTRKAQLADLQLRQQAHARDAQALASRQTALATAKAALARALDLWAAETTAALPGAAGLADLRQVLPGLRALREGNEVITGLTRQINGMTRDHDAFVARMAALAPALGAPANLAPLDCHSLARTLLADAEKTAAAFDALTATLQEASQALSRAQDDIALQDAQIRQLAGAFDPAIPTATLADLRAAVTRCRTAIDLRAAVQRQTVALTARSPASPTMPMAMPAARPLKTIHTHRKVTTAES